MKDNIDILKEVNSELERFRRKLALAIKEQSEVDNCSHRHYASCKRGALDLKIELNKLTQDTKYKYSTHDTPNK